MSVDAYPLSCNMPLPDGRNEYVQILYESGGWAIEHQGKHEIESDEFYVPAEDSRLVCRTLLAKK